MKNNHKIRLTAATLALSASFGAWAGLGGLNVQSHLGEPFSGTVTVTGEEAKALLNGGRVSVSNSGMRTSVRRSGDKAIVTIRSSRPVQDPVLIFQVNAGSQSREYTAIIDPADYPAARQTQSATAARNSGTTPAAPAQNAEREAARERIARAINRSSDTPAAARQQPSNNTRAQEKYSGIRHGKRHLVRNGETLLGIANKIRLQGMSVTQTAQALVAANPGVFINRNADKMLAGKVLNIPTREQLLKATASGASAAQTAPAATQTAPQTQPASAATPQSVPSENTRTVPAAEQSAAQTASAAQSTETQTQPAQETQQPAASAPVLMPASEAAAQTPAASAVASETTAEPPVEDLHLATDGDEGSLWRWLLMGGAAVLAALLLLRLLGRKKHAPDESAVFPETPEDDDKIVFDNKPKPSEHVSAKTATAAAAAVAGAGIAAAAKSKADDGLDMEDDFDDDIFFTDKAEPAADAHGSTFNIDLGAIDNSQNGILSGAVTSDEETEKRRDLDWDSIESTESVYEPDPEPYGHAEESPAQFVQVETRTNLADDTETDIAHYAPTSRALPEEDDAFDSAKSDAEPFEHSVQTAQSRNDEVLDFFADQRENRIQDGLETPAADDTDATTGNSGFDIRHAAIGVTAAAATAAFAVTKTEAAQQETFTEEKQDDVLSFAVEENQEPEALDFDISSDEKASEEDAYDKTLQETDFRLSSDETAGEVRESSAVNFSAVDFADTTQTEEQELFESAPADDQVKQPFNIDQDQGFSLHESEDFDSQTHVVETSDETIEWEGFSDISATDETGADGFISESVGMTAPQEAKYELAKMYVEIGDPETARETLQELLEEADGSIAEKARTLLAELG